VTSGISGTGMKEKRGTHADDLTVSGRDRALELNRVWARDRRQSF
jgi:hypothetical protein